MRNMVFTFAIPMLIAGYGLGQSVDPAKFAAVQKENAQKLRAYTWKQRLELQLKGETEKVLLNQMRYDVDGKQQKTPLSTGEPQQQAAQAPAGRRGGRLKDKIVENKKEEFEEMMEGLAALVTSYGHIPPDKLKAALSQAKVTPGQGEMKGAAGIQVASVVQGGDSLTLWVDTATWLFRRIEINSSYDQKPVTPSTTPAQTGSQARSRAGQTGATAAQPRATVQPDTFQGLNREEQARQSGAQQTQRFQNYQRQSRSYGGGRRR